MLHWWTQQISKWTYLYVHGFSGLMMVRFLHITTTRTWYNSLCFNYTLMKISQKIQQSAKDDKIWWSFEYFPPRTAQVKKKISSQPFFFQPHISFQFLGSAKSFRPYRAHASTWAWIYWYYLVWVFTSRSDEITSFFFSFHRNAGGRTSDLTSEMVKTCQGLIGIETCMHLTCTNMPKEKVDIALTVGSFPKIPIPFN